MIDNCYDLLLYIDQHKGKLHFPSSPEEVFGIDQDTFDAYIEKLDALGYINRYLRSCGITPEGKAFLDNN